MKQKISFVCQECGYDTVQWMGKCPECGEWNTFKEVKLSSPSSRAVSLRSQAGVLASAAFAPKNLSEIKYEQKQRQLTGFSEMDVVLGGGIVSGSVILLAGDPGVGKSTLLLQTALNITSGKTPKTVLYVSAEESLEQVKLRSLRIAKTKPGKNFLVLSLSDTDAVISVVAQGKPDLVIIDSIQTMESENVAGFSGSVGQVRYAAAQFIKTAKTLGIPMIMVGHVTKEGMVAGPMVLSHMVDAVLFLEGDKFLTTRVLRSLKNRFGPVDEVGVFLMEETGIEEIKNSEQLFLSKGKKESLPGSVLIVTLEGSRAFLVEIQALVVMSKLPFPRRVASGIDSRRLELLLAVLQKHAGVPVYEMDVFVNVAGGLKIQDPASDLGICLAIYSSFKNIPIERTVAIAEVGLLGELRTAPMLEKRVKEAKKLGFSNIITSANFKTLNQAFASIKA
ncbi:MAG: DNA repair protein RadA [Candidatus Levyibacteriota bacterium]